MQDYKCDINPKIIEQIRKTYTSNPDLTPAMLSKHLPLPRVSRKWVCAMSYEKVAKVVAPAIFH
jgi:dynein heavy chain